MQFPPTSDFTPLLIGGVPLFDNLNDENPNSVDIVGNSSFPAGYIAYDGESIYFRLRLHDDPRQGQGFSNFAWGILFNTSGVAGEYDWLINVNGLDETVNIVKNINKEFNEWNDPAEGVNGEPSYAQGITNYDIARVVVADSAIGSQNYFLDWFIPADTFFTVLGIDENSVVSNVYFTSANANNYNKDSLQTNEGFQFIDAFTDPITIGDTDVRARLVTDKVLTAGPSNILLGVTETWTTEVSVTNTGKSEAINVTVNDFSGLDNVDDLVISSVTKGAAVLDNVTNTITWTVGNLLPGETATMVVTVTGSFTSIGSTTRPLDEAFAEGNDDLTGVSLVSEVVQIPVSVQQAATLNGTIIDQSNGETVSGATVELRQGVTIIDSTVSLTNGFYSFVNVVPGTYDIDVSNPPEYTSTTVSVSIGSGQSVTEDIFINPVPSTIDGTVTDNALNPIAGATVTLDNNLGVPIATTTTNGAGQYSFTGVVPGSYEVEVMASGFGSDLKSVITQPGQTSTVDFTLEATAGSIAGAILDSDTSTAIPNASVELLTNDAIFLTSTTADGSGNYTFTDLSPGSYIVRAQAANYSVNSVSSIVLASQVTSTDVPLMPSPGSISGTVTDEQTGVVLGGATVQVLDSLGNIVDATLTNGSGAYTFNNLATGSYTLVFTANGYSKLVIGSVVEAGQTTTTNVSLEEIAGSLQGTVEDNTANAIAGALVTVYENQIPVATALTDENGNYFIPDLAGGAYNVVITADNYQSQSLGTTIVRGETTILNATLQDSPGTLTGSVSSSGSPLAGATIAIQNQSGIISTTFTDSNGQYVIENLAPGSYSVVASFSTYETQINGAIIEANTTTNVDFDLEQTPGGIAGEVLNAQTGIPIIGANVEVRFIDSSGAIVATVFTDEDGMYRANDLAPGFYTLVYGAEDFQTVAITTEVEAGITKIVNALLEPNPGAVNGTIINSIDESPLPGALVTIVDSNGFVVDTVTTGTNGAFNINGLAPGSYTITASIDGFQNNVTGVTVRSNEITATIIPLTPGPGRIEGTVTPSLSGTLVRLFDQNGVFIASTIPENGLFNFDNLAPGTYTVSASANEYTTDTVGVEVLSSQTSFVSLTLDPLPATVSGTITSSGGAPIANALVKIVNDAGVTLGSAFTNELGGYTLPNIPAGSFTLVAGADGFASSSVGVTTAQGQDLSGVNVQLSAATGGISGQVSNLVTGDPLVGVTITVRDPSTQTIIATTTTDVFGDYLLTSIPPGSQTVSAFLEGFARQQLGASVVAGETTSADFILDPNPGEVQGILVDGNGNPLMLSNMFVEVYNERKEFITTITVNGDGTYKVPGLIPGTYFLTASAPGYSSSTVSAVVNSNTVTAVTHTLQLNPATLNVVVLDDETGQPQAGASVIVEHTNGIPIDQGITDQNGLIRFTDLAGGEYFITATKDGFGTTSQGLFLGNGDTRSITLRLPTEVGILQGFVTDGTSGNPILDATVQVFDENGVLVLEGVTDENGRYRFEGLAPGEYTVITSAGNFSPESAGAFIIAGETSTLSFALTPNAGRIEGTVTDATTGDPVQGATIIIREGSETGPIIFTTITDENGFYQSGGLAENVYVLVTRDPNYGSETGVVTVERNQVTTLNFSLTPNPGRVQGSVRSASAGLPITGALIRVTNQDGFIIGTVPTDESGFYTLGGLAPGTYRITAGDPNFQIAKATFSVGTNQTVTRNFALQGDPATITGAVIDNENNAPLVGALVQVFDTETELLLGEALTNEDGFYAIFGLSTDTIQVLISFPGYGTFQSTFPTSAGSTADVSVRLSQTPATIRGRVTAQEGGTPIDGVTVVLKLAGATTPYAFAITNEDGDYEFTGLAPGSYTVTFVAVDFQNVSFGVVLGPNEVRILNVSLQRGGPIGLVPECIRTRKVYDWVVTATHLTRTSYFPTCCQQEIDRLLSLGETLVIQAEIEDVKERVVTIENGNPGWIKVTFLMEVTIRVINELTENIVCKFNTPLLIAEELAICIPEPFDVNNVDLSILTSKVTTEGIVSSQSYELTAFICFDVTVTCQVNLEVLGDFCSPRREIPIEKPPLKCVVGPNILPPTQCSNFIEDSEFDDLLSLINDQD
ncbi:hypothetical protein N781_09540 [Pontibacillus halophilus JSM 076056 = DSM 19796]|uniref:Uncharacterized protein n=1 Tax=Pontibacillus halophilus JSM 076056 = DSM 19796 TaxID=1385510 RepID=A0A0A5G6J8_9BACI|nr:carboxypeptidase regulatory-like domain-containing protein [Pontibacillus halophilus]KGX88751.1 hypothetical protein N781_09540 [Pontibacillus halophilus JSM 076056 = DSM 19796]